MKLLLATGNRHKVSEIGAILNEDGDLGLLLATLRDFPHLPPVVEDGSTLEQNAVKKAVTAALETGLWSLADDTGLEVPALGGAPGVFSARYAGPDCDFDANCRKLLSEMARFRGRERDAVFRCVVALASPSGTVRIAVGRLEGRISEDFRGTNGFGYDPVFFVPELDRSLAEMSLAEKNSMSHRAKAVRAARVWIEDIARTPPAGRVA